MNLEQITILPEEKNIRHFTKGGEVGHKIKGLFSQILIRISWPQLKEYEVYSNGDWGVEHLFKFKTNLEFSILYTEKNSGKFLTHKLPYSSIKLNSPIDSSKRKYLKHYLILEDSKADLSFKVNFLHNGENNLEVLHKNTTSRIL